MKSLLQTGSGMFSIRTGQGRPACAEKRLLFNGIALCLLVVLLTGCASPPYATEIRTVELIKGSQSWNGQPLPAYRTGTPEITILRITVPPHQALPMHQHPVINAGVLLKGELTVTTDKGLTKHLTANDALIEVSDTWHYGRNDGDAPAEILVFYAGEKGKPVTVRQTAPTPPKTPPAQE